MGTNIGQGHGRRGESYFFDNVQRKIFQPEEKFYNLLNNNSQACRHKFITPIRLCPSEMNETQRSKDGMAQRNEDELSYEIIGAAIEVHRTLGGPGLLEGIYESSLCHEIMLRGLQIQNSFLSP